MVLRNLFRAKARVFYMFHITGLKAGVSHKFRCGRILPIILINILGNSQQQGLKIFNKLTG